MIPRFKPNIGAEEFRKVFKWSADEQVEKFEDEFSSLVDHSYGLTFSYGRMALYAFLKAQGISGREIICPAYTCIVIAHAIEESGNRCVFVDIALDDLLMDFEKLKEAINDQTGAIIFTSLYGNPINLEDVHYIKTHYPHIKIIQDCTHLIDGKRDMQRVALLGDAAIFGLGLSKPITSIFGGILTTNDPELFKKMHEYREAHFAKKSIRGIVKRIYLILALLAFNKYFYSITNFLERHGFINYFVKLFDKDKISLPNDSFQQLSSFEATIGLCQLLKFSRTVEHSRRIAEIYQNELQGDFLKILVHPEAVVSHYNILSRKRKSLILNLLKNGIQLGDMYDYSLPDLKPYTTHRFYQDHNHSLLVSGQIINLPLCVSEREASRIAMLINKFS